MKSSDLTAPTPIRALPPTSPVCLPSLGHGERIATQHEFVRRQELDPATLKYSDEHGPRGTKPPVGLIYRCTDTGAERIWGVE